MTGPHPEARRWPRWVLVAILAASIGLRVALVLNGGQLFWLDESFRFHPCLQIVDAIRYPNHTWGEVADVVARQHLHTGFIFFGIPATAAGLKLLDVLPLRDVQTATALVLSLASVAVIALLYASARRLGAGRVEATLAAALAAASNSLFYNARHVLPYDSSLALVILMFWLSVHPRTGLARSFALGVVGAAAYLTYFGYLTSVLAVAIAYLVDLRRPGRMIANGIALAGGFSVLPLAMHAYTLVHPADAPPFLKDVLALMKLANQGAYAEGWWVPWAYLWHSEHGVLLLWIAGAAATVGCALVDGRAARSRGLVGLGIATVIYGLLVLNSTLLQNSVVLGRFARQLVPFLCLATAAAARDLADRRVVPTAAWAALALLVLAQATANFAVPLRQWFIPEMEDAARLVYGNAPMRRELSVTGPEWDRPPDGDARYVLMNTATFLYPAQAVAPVIPGTVVMRHDHPLQFFPYQYEVFDEAGRTVLRAADISMRLIDTATVP